MKDVKNNFYFSSKKTFTRIFFFVTLSSTSKGSSVHYGLSENLRVIAMPLDNLVIQEPKRLLLWWQLTKLIHQIGIAKRIDWQRQEVIVVVAKSAVNICVLCGIIAFNSV